MKLNGRLKLIADSIPDCKVLADIGTDHGYIPIKVVLAGTCERALAADLRPGPLRMAQKNIRKYGLEKRIETRLGDGLEPILPTECEVIIIAGMGGSLIRRILSDSYNKAKSARLLLLQPNNAADALRRWLFDNGFCISGEKLVEDGRKLYCLIEAHWTGKRIIRDSFDCYIGEKIFTGNDMLLEKYLRKKLCELDTIITGRAGADPEKQRRIGAEVELDTDTCVSIRRRLLEYLDGI